MAKILKYLVYYSILAAMLLPAIQTVFKPFDEKPLNGDFTLSGKPGFSWKAWFESSYQGPFEQYLKDQGGFRAFFIRVFNQVDFSLFRKANAEGVVIGKDDYLFEFDYIRAWAGQDFIGEDFIRKKMARVKFVADHLKREKDIDLIIVFEPGKASFYPEYIPEKFHLQKKDPTNLDTYIKFARKFGVQYTDLNQYFLRLKNQVPYPLFPRYGTHWSEYGMTFAADSLLRLIEITRKIDLAPFAVTSIDTDTRPRSTDNDVYKTMNLIFPVNGDTLAYPVYAFDTAGQYDKPMVLAVADSYYWNIMNAGIPRYFFANQAFWYFNARVYPDFYQRPVVTSDLDLRKEIEKQQLILVMVTERFMYKFDWGFIDQLYAMYAPPWLVDPVYDRINTILNYSPWFADVEEKAGKMQISLEESLVKDATFLFFQKDKASYFTMYGHEHFARIIREDTAWYGHIVKKAGEQSISAEEMLARDADHTFRLHYPDLQEISKGIRETMKTLQKDTLAMANLAREAAYYGFDPGIYIYIIAEKIYTEKRLQNIMANIRNDETWLNHIKDKAAMNKISVDEMLFIDARYVYDQMRHPKDL